MPYDAVYRTCVIVIGLIPVALVAIAISI